MEPSGINLPDFSKGETFVDISYPSFEPLFPKYSQSAEFALPDADNGLTGRDELAGLSSAVAELGGMEESPTNPVKVQEESGPSLAEHESILSDLAKHHSDEIDELKSKHQLEVLRQLDELQPKAIEAVANRIETTLVSVLSNLFQERLNEISIEKLAKKIHAVVQKSAIDRLQVSGPPSLTSELVAALPHGGLPIEVEDSDSVDLTISFNDKNISTNIGDWMKQLEEALS